ncbi:hypothetical protein MACH23_21450 [Sulfitobacter pontiacus]|nr:hypothetical protein MACH23_21450 [Sulfitobacter pontiacus]
MRPEGDIVLYLKSQLVAVELLGFVLVVNEDAGHIDFHINSSVHSCIGPGLMQSPRVFGSTLAWHREKGRHNGPPLM